MSSTDDWSPDEPLDTETFESWDEDLDEEDRVTPDSIHDPEGERGLDTELFLDDEAAEEAGAELDDPERLAVLDGTIDDPDGVEPDERGSRSADDQGWDLDAEERQTATHLDDDADSTQ